MGMNDQQIHQMLDFAERSSPEEACGLVLDSGRIFPCRNVHPHPEAFFDVDAAGQAAAQQLGRIVGVWHSHPSCSAEPSWIDRAMCERTAMAWHIVSLIDGKYQLLQPSGWIAPYEGRPYCYGVFDCWELVRDWYARERGVRLLRPIEQEGWWNLGIPLFEQHAEEAGFSRVDQPLPGDLVMMQIGASVSNHLGVFLPDGRILHHLRDRLSETHRYGGYWQRCTVGYWRYQR